MAVRNAEVDSISQTAAGLKDSSTQLSELFEIEAFLAHGNSVSRRAFVSASAFGAFALALGVSGGVLAGCSKKESAQQEDVSEAYDPSLESTRSKKTLVAYFSAQGHTKAVAEAIADELDADIFKIAPKTAYTESDLDKDNSQSRVSREHSNEQLRHVDLQATVPERWTAYGTVIVAYPIWWDVAAWPASTFVADNDFSDKTVIPVCTSSYSGIEESANALRESVKSGDWKDGKRFDENASTDEARQWAASLK